jgi:hypothetical protein
MKKSTILGDTFEQLAELGQSTAKKTVKSVAQTLNPFDKRSGDKVSGPEKGQGGKSPEINREKNHTPVDFKNLQEKFQNKDKLEAEALSRLFFQNVKREDQKILERKEMKEMQKNRQEEQEEQDKKRKDQQKKQSQQQDNIPGGKAKRGVATRKKTSEQQHVENKPATGKQ